MRLRIHPFGYFDRRSFHRLRRPLVERHVRHKRLRAGRSLLIGLQVHVHVAFRAEHARDAGNQLHTVLHERIHGLRRGGLIALLRIQQRRAHRLALAAQHHRGDRHHLLHLFEVLNVELTHEGADSARFAVPSHNLDRMVARHQRVPGIIRDRVLHEFGGSGVGERNVEPIANISLRRAGLVLNFANEIDQRMFRAAFFRQSQFAAGNLHHDRREVLGPVDLEVIHFERDGELRDRVARHERVLELPLFVRCREFAEDFIRIVPLAEFKIRLHAIIQRHLDPAELAVGRVVSRVVANDVVTADRLFGIDNALPQVVEIEHRFPACIRSQRIERVLRFREVRLHRLRRRAGVHARVSLRPLGGEAQRRRRDQAAGINRPELHPGADRVVDRRAQLRLIVDAVEIHPAGKVDEHLLFAQRSQGFRDGLKRGQLPVGIEDIEFGVVLPERGSGVGGTGVGIGFAGVIGLAHHERGDDGL